METTGNHKEKYMQKKKKHKYKPTATLKDYQEAIQILMVDYADVWEKTGTFKEVDKKLKKLGIWRELNITT